MILKIKGKDVGIITVVDLATDTGLPLSPIISILITEQKMILSFRDQMEGKDEETGIVDL